jgi:hypothetical protein
MTTTAWRVVRIAWIVLAILTGGISLAGVILPAWLSLLLVLPAILAWSVLLVVYHRTLGQWRGVFLSWLAFGILRAAAAWLGAGDGSPRDVAASLLALLCLYAWLGGYAALVALVIRRDVCVAYIFIPAALGALAMLLTVRSAGGVTQWFDALTSAATVWRALLLEPLLLSLTCMNTLGFIAAVPYVIITVFREMQGN